MSMVPKDVNRLGISQGRALLNSVSDLGFRRTSFEARYKLLELAEMCTAFETAQAKFPNKAKLCTCSN